MTACATKPCMRKKTRRCQSTRVWQRHLTRRHQWHLVSCAMVRWRCQTRVNWQLRGTDSPALFLSHAMFCPTCKPPPEWLVLRGYVLSGRKWRHKRLSQTLTERQGAGGNRRGWKSIDGWMGHFRTGCCCCCYCTLMICRRQRLLIRTRDCRVPIRRPSFIRRPTWWTVAVFRFGIYRQTQPLCPFSFPPSDKNYSSIYSRFPASRSACLTVFWDDRLCRMTPNVCQGAIRRLSDRVP